MLEPDDRKEIDELLEYQRANIERSDRLQEQAAAALTNLKSAIDMLSKTEIDLAAIIDSKPKNRRVG